MTNKKEKKKLRRKGICAQNAAAGRGHKIPKLIVVMNQMRAAAERADDMQ